MAKKKTKKKKKPEIISWGSYAELFGNYDKYCFPRPATKAEKLRQKREEKKRKLAELKEKRRKAKKITMTVGEYEKAIEEAKRLVED